MKRVALYIRVSSDKQAKEGDSVSAQLDALRKYSAERNYKIVGEFIDDGISGTKYEERKKLQELLAFVRDGCIDLLLVTKLDRLFRSIRWYTYTQEALDKCGVGWTAIWEPIYDTTTPQGRLIVNQMMSIAQFEAENTGQRIRQVQAYKLTQKEVISGSTPPGYSIVKKHLQPNEDAQNVLTAFETYSRTGSFGETMREVVGLHGLPRSRRGFKSMLRNSLYIGRHPSGVEDFCPPIIPLHLYEDVQRQLRMNIKKSQKEVYVFSGLIKCAECGGSFTADTRRRKRGNGALRIIHQYRCARHYNSKPSRCGNPKVIAEKSLEKYLVGNLQSIVQDLIVRVEAEEAPARDRAAQIAALQRKADRLKELYINDLITIEEYKSDRERYARQIEDLRQAQTRPADAAGAMEDLRRIARADLREIYHDLTPEERRRFWRGILDKISMDAGRKLQIVFAGGRY